jgi:peptidase M16-like protein
VTGGGRLVVERQQPGRIAVSGGAVLRTPLVATPAAVVAATLAVPLSAARRRDVLVAPLVAAHWADAVGTAAGRDGARVRVAPVVSADLAGITVECVSGEHAALAALPGWFAAAAASEPASGLEPVRRRALARSRGEDRWSDVVRRSLFDPAHRYAVGAAEVAGQVARCGWDDLVASLRWLTRPPPVLALSVMDDEVLGAWAGELAGDWPEPPPSPDPTPQRLVRIHLPADAGPAQLLLGTPGVALGSVDKFAVHLVWAMLGGREGLLERRLRGLTYAIAAFSRELAEGGYGVCYLRCDAAALDQVVDRVAEVLIELAEGRFGGPELVSARERLLIAQLLATQTGQGITERLCALEVGGVTADPTGYQASIRGVTGAGVAQAAHRCLGLSAAAVREALPGGRA